MTITHVTYDIDILKAEIAAGVHDNDLAVICKAAGDRLIVTRTERKITDFCIGDRVKLNDLCGTQYLRNCTGYIVSKRRTKVIIKLDTPIGRFVRVTSDGVRESSEITVPVSILDKI